VGLKASEDRKKEKALKLKTEPVFSKRKEPGLFIGKGEGGKSNWHRAVKRVELGTKPK